MTVAAAIAGDRLTLEARLQRFSAQYIKNRIMNAASNLIEKFDKETKEFL